MYLENLRSSSNGKHNHGLLELLGQGTGACLLRKLDFIPFYCAIDSDIDKQNHSIKDSASIEYAKSPSPF